MKRLFAIAVLAALFMSLGSATADSPRKVLFQHFTSASCGPCAASAPAYYGYLKSNLDKVIPISFHGNFNQDIMEDHYGAAAAAYAQKYAITGVPTLVISGNKYKGAPAPPTGYTNIVNQLASENSPFTINITREQLGITNNITVNLHSSRKYLNDLNLRVAVVEAYHHYEEAGTNGEKDFYFINRDMLPDPDGEVFKVNANDSKTFNFSFNLHPEWHPNMIFVVAWVQNDSEKEIYQAASTPIPSLTNIESKPTFTLKVTCPDKVGKVKEMEGLSKQVTITNPNPFPVKTAIAVVDKMSSIPDDWTVAIDKTEETVPAGGSTVVNVTITPGAEAGLATITIGAFPLENISLPISDYTTLYLMSEQVKYAIFNAPPLSYYGPYLFQYSLSTTIYGDKIALLPFSQDIISAFTPDDFDVAIFSTTTRYGSISFLIPEQVDYMKAMLAKGKNVFVATDASGLASQQTSMLPPEYINAINDFFTNVAKVNYESTRGYVQNNTLYRYKVSGANKDTVSGRFVSDFNVSTQMFSPYSEMFTIPEGSPAKPIFFYDDDLAKIAGARLENDNGSKLVFLGFPLEYAASLQMQQTLLKDAMRWFVGETVEPKPSILTDVSDIEFGQVTVGESKDVDVEVYNLGNADLKISKLEITNDFGGVFEVVNPEPQVVAPGKKTIYTVRFTPAEEKVYTFADFVIYNNDKDYKNLSISLRGTGVLPQATGARVKMDVEAMNFEFVNIGEYADREVKITNTGIAPLSITELRMDGEGKDAFEFISLPPDNEIAPSATYIIRVRFRPTDKVVYNATVKFTANDPEQPYFEIPMTGTGLEYVGVTENNNDVFQFSVGPNPLVNSTNVRLNVLGDLNSDALIYLVDATGKNVAMLVNGAIASGEHNFKFDASYLPSGTYYMICTIGNRTSSIPVVIAK